MMSSRACIFSLMGQASQLNILYTHRSKNYFQDIGNFLSKSRNLLYTQRKRMRSGSAQK